MPKVLPISAKPEAVKDTVALTHTPAGVAFKLPTTGQTSQPPGPDRVTANDAVQLFKSVTVTLYVPTVRPLWSSAPCTNPLPLAVCQVYVKGLAPPATTRLMLPLAATQVVGSTVLALNEGL